MKRGLLKTALRHLCVLAGFAALALAYTWPLAARFNTHFPGTQPESFNNIWNLWHYFHAVHGLRTNPLWTDLQYWPYGANLLLVHYTLLNDAIASVLGPHLGLHGTYNLLYLASLTLSGYGVFLFLADFGVGAAAAFVAGAAYAFSPIMTLQVMTGRGLDYTSFHTLPFFAWFLFRTLRDGKLKDAVLAALFLSLTWLYNYYYFLSGLLLIPVAFWVRRWPVSLSWQKRKGGEGLRLVRLAGLGALAGAAVVVARSWAGGQVEWHGAGSVRQVLAYMSPYLLFWGLAAALVLLYFRPRAVVEREAFAPKAWLPTAAVAASWAAMNWPLIGALALLMAAGDYGAPMNRWRGGGNPMDAAWLLMPAYFQPLWRSLAERVMGPSHFSGFGWVPVIAGLWLSWRRPRDPWVRAWGWCFGLFCLLTLGPWLKAFGTHLYLPLPFYFLHALPVFLNMPNGMYFNVIASLFLALLLGAALREASAKAGPRWARVLPWLVGLAMAFEFWPGGIKTFRPEFPGLIHRLRDRPDGAILPVPVSANFHIIVNPGPIGDEFMDLELAQVVHQKPYIGGHLGRVARRVYGYMSADPIFQGLLKAQSGGEISRLLKDKVVIRRYLRDSHLSYVLVEESRIPAGLKKVLAGWPLTPIDREGTLVLYLVQSRRSHG